MKFWEIFRFEFAYQIRRAWPWLFFAVILVLSFLMTRDGSLAEVLYADFFLNSPFAVAKTTVFGSLVWLIMAAAVSGDAAARDVQIRMYPLTYTLPVSKVDYLGGRFLAALLLNALILLAVQVGILLGVYLPGVNAELIGPFRPATYLTSYAYIALPNAFVATAIQFSLAARSGRAMASYVGSFLLVFMGFFVASLVFYKRGLGTLLDPIGIRFIVEDLSHSWTTIEMSWRLIELKGTMLTNRLLWLGIALGVLAVTYLGFRFAHRTESNWWRRKTRFFTQFRTNREDIHSPTPSAIAITGSTPIPVPYIPRTFGFTTHARQMLTIAWASFRMIATSWAGLAMLVAIPLVTVLVIVDQMESNGVPLLPTTHRVIAELTAPLSAEMSRWVIIPLLIILFAGELVWREREARLGEITDTMPGSEWSPFLGKFLGLSLVLVIFMAVLTIAGILAQVILGYQDFEIGLYLKILFGFQLSEYLLLALLTLVVHVLVNQKYIGHLVAIGAYVFIAISPLFGIEHNMLVYGASPAWSYTEMRGFGPFLEPWLWFKLYWAAWALLLAVVAKLLWVRGREQDFSVRFQIALRRFKGLTVWTAAIAMGLILTLGAFIFYNTNILNKYLTASEIKERSAEYERRYGQYASIPQPQLTATNLHVEIYPERQAVDIRGMYHLVNRSTVAIDSILVAFAPEVETSTVALDQSTAHVLNDEKLSHRIYVLKKPLQPGDSLRFDFQVHVKPHGFRESGVDASVMANGTSFTNSWLPRIGYQSSRELISASDRREYGLKPRPLIASLYDVEARKNRGAGIALETVVGTDEHQVAVAPGALHRTWTKDGRRYFHYATDGSIGDEWTFFSANYKVHEASWKNPDGSGKPVAIRILHHPKHTAQLDRMVQGIQASLGYYTKQFGPYRYNHISVVERAGNGVGMHADPSLLIYSEGFATWLPKDNPQVLDMPFAVVTHEMAHQWTVPSAYVEGAPVMSESLAWYYGMKAVEKAKGPAHLRRLLNFMRQPYPYSPIRRGEPLLRGLDQYLSYRRGPFALYALSEYLGENQVNKALRLLVEKHRSPDAPLATTLDLYGELKAVTPDSLQYLLHDLFEVNTYWELKTERVTAKQTQAGTWQVTLDVRARKMMYDSAGVEMEIPMNEWMQIGVFAQAEDGDKLSKPLDVKMHRIRSGKQTITLTVRGKPINAGIDPYHLLDWQERDGENIKMIKIE